MRNRLMLVTGAVALIVAGSFLGLIVTSMVRADGGDATLVHACVRIANGEIRVIHPGPGDENLDCTAIAGFTNVHLDDDWTGAGTGSMSPVDLLDNVGIGTATPNEQLEITGNFRLPTSTATAGVIKSAGNSFIHSFGTDNFFAGVNAGNLTMAGERNTGVGVGALASNGVGPSNTATGHQALQSNTEGGGNTAAGAFALLSNTTGFENTAAGAFALDSNTTGSNNVAAGAFALTGNRTGSSNTASGSSALLNNFSGADNTATGRGALILNISGSFNTAAGKDALSGNITGSSNTAVGFLADVGADNLTNATAIGANATVDASNKIRLGDANVTVVEAAGSFISTGGGFIGTELDIDSATLFVDSINDRVGIGTSIPNEQLEITGNLRLPESTTTEGVIMSDGNPFIHSFGTNSFFAGVNSGNLTMTGFGHNTGVGVDALGLNTTGSENTASGNSALFNNNTGSSNTAAGLAALQGNSTGSFNTAIGREALTSNRTGSNNTAIGFLANVGSNSLTNATAVGANATVDASNKIRLGDAAVTVVETAGDVFVETQGLGIILRDTDGAGCHRITVDSAGTLSATVVTCP